ncbi:MAG: hypothetical protein AB7T27_01925 [Kiritimatiellia bacterium]
MTVFLLQMHRKHRDGVAYNGHKLIANRNRLKPLEIQNQFRLIHAAHRAATTIQPYLQIRDVGYNLFVGGKILGMPDNNHENSQEYQRKRQKHPQINFAEKLSDRFSHFALFLSMPMN